MYLKQTKKASGRNYLSIVRGYRKDGKVKTRTVESLGYLDELEAKYPDPIAHFKEVCDRRNKKDGEASAAQTITFRPLQRIDMRADGRKNIGCAVALSHYNSLGIEKALRNAMRDSKAAYDINAVFRLLVIERMLNPSSRLSAYENKGSYFFRSGFTDDDVYRSLDSLAKSKRSVIAAMNRAIESSGRRGMGHVFYDVTNCYFEIDEEDGLRRRGVEKNRRPGPIIQMGLLQDAHAIPLGYGIFPGNTNDCLTLLPVLKNLKRELSLERVIVVADKGLNTSDDIAANMLDGNGFVFSQSIRATKSSAGLRDWVLDDEGYAANGEGTFKVKSRQDSKTIHVQGPDGKDVDVDIAIKVVAYWSKKHEVRSRMKRAEAIEKAKRLVADPSAFSKATGHGAARYVRNITFDKKTGEVIESAGKHAELDDGAIAQAEACDGYYCIITSETGLDDTEVIEIYKGLWRIEEAFKVTKSDMELRPSFVRLPEHIEAHFLSCYTALTIMRLMQLDTGFSYSSAVIKEELGKMSGTHEQDNWWVFNHRSEATDTLCATVGIDLTRKRMQLKEIKAVLTAVNGKTGPFSRPLNYTT
jgi:transposase